MSPRLRQTAVACLLCASALVLPGTAVAEPVAYASGFDTLYRIDLADGKATPIGAFGAAGAGALIGDVEGLAIAPDGTLFAVSDARKTLLRVDTATGHATTVGELRDNGQVIGDGLNLDFGLAFTCDGRLWLSSDKTSRLWEVTPGNGAVRAVGATAAKLSGLAARGNALYGLGAEGDEALYRVDTATAQSTLVGRLANGLAYPDAGMDFDASGRLWAVLDFFPPVERSDVARIDLATGAVTMGAQITGPGIDDKEIESIAIGPPGGCGPQGPIGAPLEVPASSALGAGLLATLAALFGLIVLRRRRPV